MRETHPTLIIVSGLPATGKTTLARRLAAHFTLPLIHKDTIKETLCVCSPNQNSNRSLSAAMSLNWIPQTSQPSLMRRFSLRYGGSWRIKSVQNIENKRFFARTFHVKHREDFMDSSTLWQQTLQEYQQKGVIAISCEEIDAETRLQTLSEAEPPPPVAAFLQRWRQTSHDSWQALLQNAIMVNPGIVKQLTSASFLQPLRALLASAEYAAILCQTHADWREKQQWSYLFQLKSPQDQNIEEASYIVLHIPASPQEIAAAEAVLRLTLPPSYRCFLSITNGLGIGTFSITGIYGAGPTRANWDAVVLNQWSECEKYRHEIAAEWRSFQGVYDYERIMDWERGENSFGSDETILVPFAYTYETWCFDRTRSGENGEYPVMFWDHETREASEYYADFPAWFSNEIVPYLFDE